MASQETTKRDKMGSPLNFEWCDEQFIDPKAKLDDLDPFLESNDGSLASEDNLDFPEGPKVIGLPTGDIPRPGTIALDSRKRSVSSTISNQSDGIVTISRRKKKPKGMPKRPLSAYNLYFQSERAKILAAAEGEGEKIGFEGLGKIIGKKWRSLTAEDLKLYEKLAEKDSVRYRKEMEVYNENKAKRLGEDTKIASPRVPSTTATSIESGFGASSYQPALPLRENSFRVSTGNPGQPPPTGTREEFLRLHALTTSNQVTDRGPQQHTFAQRAHLDIPGLQAGTGFPTHYDNSAQAGLHAQNMQHLPLSAVVAASPSVKGGPHGNSFPMPPDMEIILSDRNGKDRKYRVQYTCYAMTKDAAHKFIDGMMGPSSNEARAPQQSFPPGQHPAAPPATSMPQPVSVPMVSHPYGAPQFAAQQLPPGYVPVSQM